MNLQEYINLSEKTLSTEFHSDKKMENILHAAIGLATEIDELLDNYENEMDPINLLEEVGDIYWYLAIFYREYPGSEKINQFLEKKSPEKIVMDILKSILKIQDMIKKKLFYNKNIDSESLIGLVISINSNLSIYLEKYNLNIEDVWCKNINKLKARYGDKFSSEKAINRDLVKEKNILENE
jgi:NTP pyrophosphatase (non-canonical NTP hydrolase)